MTWETYDNGQLVERITITKSGGGATYQRWTQASGLVEDRAATQDEIAQLERHERSERAANEPNALRAAARLIADDRVKAGALTDEDVAKLSALYDPWVPGGTYEAGDLYSWDGTVIECDQGHTNNDPSHTPDATPNLWIIHRSSGTIEAWSQPPSNNPYRLGALVTHNGRLWESDHDANVWEPGTTGAPWTDIGPA